MKARTYQLRRQAVKEEKEVKGLRREVYTNRQDMLFSRRVSLSKEIEVIVPAQAKEDCCTIL